MKKMFILVVLAGLLIQSCSKDDEAEPKTTYRIVNNMPYYSSTDSYLNGTIYEVIVYCYKGNDIVRQDNIENIPFGGGSSKYIEAPFEKIKFSFKFLPPESPNYNLTSNVRHYVVAFTLLQKGKNVDAVLDRNTMVSNYP